MRSKCMSCQRKTRQGALTLIPHSSSVSSAGSWYFSRPPLPHDLTDQRRNGGRRRPGGQFTYEVNITIAPDGTLNIDEDYHQTGANESGIRIHQTFNYKNGQLVGMTQQRPGVNQPLAYKFCPDN